MQQGNRYGKSAPLVLRLAAVTLTVLSFLVLLGCLYGKEPGSV